ncbi:hypothetical protein CHUAL_001052 [Chamberlinius hualienensis]
MKLLVLCAFAVVLLAVANVNGLPTIPCEFVGQYIADTVDCTIYYHCDASLYPVEFQCDGFDCWYQDDKICVANRLLCGCAITTP